MKISNNKFVSVSYDLQVGEGEECVLMESATAERPLQFIFGMGTMLQDFEKNIFGKEPGEEFNFSLAPENAYGEYRDDHVIEVAKKIFEIEGKFDNEHISEGATVPMINADGDRMNGSVLEVKDDVVVMDFNHPLAGETLHFSGKVLDVHEPTKEEIEAINKMMSGGCGCGCESCSDGCGDGGCDHEHNHGCGKCRH